MKKNKVKPTYVTTRFNGGLHDITVETQGTVYQLALFSQSGKKLLLQTYAGV
jgi:hypothetical protein